MALNITAPQEYQLFVYGNGGDSVNAGSMTWNLHQWGFRIINPLDIEFKYNELTMPETDGALGVFSGYRGPSTIAMVGTLHSKDDPDDTLDALSNFVWQVGQFQTSQNNYLEFQLWDGSVLRRYRRYGFPQNIRANYAHKTRFEAFEDVTLEWRCTDPGLYYGVAENHVISVVGGTGSVNVAMSRGIELSKRFTINIIKTGASSPTNVTVAMTGAGSDKQFTITGTLASINDKWVIDNYHGSVSKVVSGVATNDIANFSGEFLEIRGSSDTIQITDGGSASFNVDVYYLPRQS